MIDIYRSRRDYNLRCAYYKAKGSHTATGRLEYESAPAGVFYARYEGGKYAANAQIANVFQSEVSTITISTPDDADLEPNDLVTIDGEPWIAVNSQRVYDRKNQFNRLVQSTVIYLRKGIR